MTKLVVFDWNGTILSDTVASWRAANVCLEFFGAPEISLARYRETFHFPVMHFYTRNGCSVDQILAKKDESNVVFQSSYERFAKNSRTRSGAREILKFLKNQNISRIILSNYLTHRIEAQLIRLGLADDFDHVCAHDCDGTTILQSTTKLERLRSYIETHGFDPGDVMVVGDSMEEPDIARKLGITSVSITDGYISRARLKAARPDHIIHRLDTIKSLV